MQESRTKNSIKNISFNIISQILAILLGFVSRSVFLYCLSVEYLGIQGLFSDILSMLSLADLGLNTVMAYTLYKPLAENDQKKIAGLITFYKKVYTVIAASITIIGLCLIPFLKYLINLDTEIPHITTYYILYLANTVASYLVVYKTAVLSADQKTYVLTKYNLAFSVAKTVLGIVILLLTRNYLLYLISSVVLTYLQNFYASFKAQQMYPYINEKVELEKSETGSIFKDIKSAFIYKISVALITATDNMLISVIVSTAMVGYYSNYIMVVTKITALVNTIFYSLTASLGNLVISSNESKRYEIFNIMQTVSTFLSTFCVIGILFLEQNFIRLWLGSEYLLDDTVLFAIVFNFYLSILLLPIWVYGDATGLYIKLKYIVLITGILNIILSIVLGKIFGLAGILIATSLSRLLTYFWYEPKLLFKIYFDKSCLEYFLRIGKNLFITAFAIGLNRVLTNSLIIDSWLMFIVKGVIISIATIACLILFYSKDEGYAFLRNKVKGMIKNLS